MDIDNATAMKMMVWGVIALCLALIPPIVTIAAMVRCNKNKDLTRGQKWAWQAAHMILMFPAFIYLIVVDKSRSWKIAGVISLVVSVALFIYLSKTASGLPDLTGLGGGLGGGLGNAFGQPGNYNAF